MRMSLLTSRPPYNFRDQRHILVRQQSHGLVPASSKSAIRAIHILTPLQHGVFHVGPVLRPVKGISPRPTHILRSLAGRVPRWPGQLLVCGCAERRGHGFQRTQNETRGPPPELSADVYGELIWGYNELTMIQVLFLGIQCLIQLLELQSNLQNSATFHGGKIRSIIFVVDIQNWECINLRALKMMSCTFEAHQRVKRAKAQDEGPFLGNFQSGNTMLAG